MSQLDRITSSPDILHGKARIKGQRITVEAIVGRIACGDSIDQVLIDFPTLQQEDVTQALWYAAQLTGKSNVSVAA